MSTDTREALPPLPKKRRAMFCTKCGFSGPTEAEASPQGAPCQRCSYTAFVEELDYGDDEMQAYARAALATQPAQPSAQGEAVACDEWEGAEEWMPLAWELCADECGEEACTELVWEGGPVPEPWGDRWLKYEGEAKRLIALVRKHVPAAAAPAAPAQAVPLTEEQIDQIADDGHRNAVGGIYATAVYQFAAAIERAHGIAPKAAQQSAA